MVALLTALSLDYCHLTGILARGERERISESIVSKVINRFSISVVLYLSTLTKALRAIIYIKVFYESVGEKK